MLSIWLEPNSASTPSCSSCARHRSSCFISHMRFLARDNRLGWQTHFPATPTLCHAATTPAAKLSPGPTSEENIGPDHTSSVSVNTWNVLQCMYSDHVVRGLGRVQPPDSTPAHCGIALSANVLGTIPNRSVGKECPDRVPQRPPRFLNCKSQRQQRPR